MGKIDTATRSYISDKEIFADVFNGTPIESPTSIGWKNKRPFACGGSIFDLGVLLPMAASRS